LKTYGGDAEDMADEDWGLVKPKKGRKGKERG
jgi:hypothetical protein